MDDVKGRVHIGCSIGATNLAQVSPGGALPARREMAWSEDPSCQTPVGPATRIAGLSREIARIAKGIRRSSLGREREVLACDPAQELRPGAGRDTSVRPGLAGAILRSWWLGVDWDDTLTRGAELAKALSWYLPVAAVRSSPRWQELEHRVLAGDFRDAVPMTVLDAVQQDRRFLAVRQLKGLSRSDTLSRMLELQDQWRQESQTGERTAPPLLTGDELLRRRTRLKEVLVPIMTESFQSNVGPIVAIADLAIPVAIVTSATREQVDRDAARLEIPIDRLTSTVVCVGDGGPDTMTGEPGSNPKALAFVEAARRLGLAADEGIAFDDSPAGVSAAVTAKLKAIGISGGDESTVAVLRSAGAAGVLSDLETAVAGRHLGELLDRVSASEVVRWLCDPGG